MIRQVTFGFLISMMSSCKPISGCTETVWQPIAVRYAANPDPLAFKGWRWDPERKKGERERKERRENGHHQFVKHGSPCCS